MMSSFVMSQSFYSPMADVTDHISVSCNIFSMRVNIFLWIIMFFGFDMSQQILMILEALSTFWTDIVKVLIFMCFFMNNFGLKSFESFGTFIARELFWTNTCFFMQMNLIIDMQRVTK